MNFRNQFPKDHAGITSGTFDMVAKTFRGLEDVLAGEIEAIGGSKIRKGTRVVHFSGNK